MNNRYVLHKVPIFYNPFKKLFLLQQCQLLTLILESLFRDSVNLVSTPNKQRTQKKGSHCCRIGKFASNLVSPNQLAFSVRPPSKYYNLLPRTETNVLLVSPRDKVPSIPVPNRRNCNHSHSTSFKWRD